MTPNVPRSRTAPPYSSDPLRVAQIEPVERVHSFRRRSKVRAPVARGIGAAHPVVAPAVESNTDAVSVDRAAQDGHTIHILARHTHADKALGDRVTALDRDPGQVDPGAGRRGDQHAALARIGDPVAAGADANVPLHLRARATQADAGRVGSERRGGAQQHRAGEPCYGV